MYAQAVLKPNTLLRNGAYGIVMRGVHFCTRGCSSLRGRKRLPLCCIKLDTATEVGISEEPEIQKKIARYLAMLDEKIELNMAINKNLLQQTTALFYNYFDKYEGNNDGQSCCWSQ